MVLGKTCGKGMPLSGPDAIHIVGPYQSFFTKRDASSFLSQKGIPMAFFSTKRDAKRPLASDSPIYVYVYLMIMLALALSTSGK